jgi:hypothetical protein
MNREIREREFGFDFRVVSGSKAVEGHRNPRRWRVHDDARVL